MTESVNEFMSDFESMLEQAFRYYSAKRKVQKKLLINYVHQCALDHMTHENEMDILRKDKRKLQRKNNRSEQKIKDLENDLKRSRTIVLNQKKQLQSLGEGATNTPQSLTELP